MNDKQEFVDEKQNNLRALRAIDKVVLLICPDFVEILKKYMKFFLSRMECCERHSKAFMVVTCSSVLLFYRRQGFVTSRGVSLLVAFARYCEPDVE
jgi:hypothetical protein